MTQQAITSIIIPIYNAKKYLADCLDSALAQSYQSVEIICVNDGSTDLSANILEEFSDRFSSIKTYHFEKNLGASTARNKGLEMAHGEYLFFLDADDLIPQDAIESLYAATKQDSADLIVGKLGWLKHGAQVTDKQSGSSVSTPPLTTTARGSEYLQSIPGCHCCNLYRRQFLIDQNIRYATDLSFGEDQLFQATAIVKAEKVTLIDKVVYFYHHYRSESMTRKLPSLDNLLDDIEYQRRMALVFMESGLEEAGRRLLKRWSYPIRQYWVKIPESLALQDATCVFSAFRSVIEEFKVTPWTAATSTHHRHLLELIMAGKDREAFAFLGTNEARN